MTDGDWWAWGICKNCVVRIEALVAIDEIIIIRGNLFCYCDHWLPWHTHKWTRNENKETSPSSLDDELKLFVFSFLFRQSVNVCDFFVYRYNNRLSVCVCCIRLSLLLNCIWFDGKLLCCCCQCYVTVTPSAMNKSEQKNHNQPNGAHFVSFLFFDMITHCIHLDGTIDNSYTHITRIVVLLIPVIELFCDCWLWWEIWYSPHTVTVCAVKLRRVFPLVRWRVANCHIRYNDMMRVVIFNYLFLRGMFLSRSSSLSLDVDTTHNCSENNYRWSWSIDTKYLHSDCLMATSRQMSRRWEK